MNGNKILLAGGMIAYGGMLLVRKTPPIDADCRVSRNPLTPGVYL
jgi:hypothetical protein